MSYLVLARKWRPTTFSELVGQQHVVQTLSNAIATGRVHHAFLFTGCRGVGKTSAARILAKSLNCEQGLSVTPCGKCTNCLEISDGSSPDVYEIDGASNTSVDNIRELRDSVHYLPAKSRFKIYIIDEVHMLSTSAFNALLKTLEEPPPHVKFIFATTEPQKIPITILSRCQRFDFRRVSGNEMLSRLRTMMDSEKINISDPALRVIIRESQGSMRDAQSLLEQAIAFCGDDLSEQKVIEAIGAVDRHYVEETLQGIILRNPGRALEAVNHVYGAGHDLIDFTSLLAELLRDLAVISAGLNADSLERSETEQSLLVQLAKNTSAIDIQRFFSFISNTAKELRAAPIPKLVLDMAILRCCAIEKAQNLSTILNEMRQIYAGAPVKPAIPENYQFPQNAPVIEKPQVSVPQHQEQVATSSPEITKEPPSEQKIQPEVSTVQTPQPVLQQAEKSPNIPEEVTDSEEKTVAEAPKETPVKTPAPDPIEAEEEPPLPDDDYIAASNTGYDDPIEVPAVNTAPTTQNCNWSEFVSKAIEINPTIGSVLEHAYLIEFSRDLIKISFNNNDFYRSHLLDPVHKGNLLDIAKKYLNSLPKLEIVDTIENAQAPICEQASTKELNRIREMHQQAQNDPRVNMAMKILDGALDSIKLL